MKISILSLILVSTIQAASVLGAANSASDHAMNDDSNKRRTAEVLEHEGAKKQRVSSDQSVPAAQPDGVGATGDVVMAAAAPSATASAAAADQKTMAAELVTNPENPFWFKGVSVTVPSGMSLFDDAEVREWLFSDPQRNKNAIGKWTICPDLESDMTLLMLLIAWRSPLVPELLQLGPDVRPTNVSKENAFTTVLDADPDLDIRNPRYGGCPWGSGDQGKAPWDPASAIYEIIKLMYAQGASLGSIEVDIDKYQRSKIPRLRSTSRIASTKNPRIALEQLQKLRDEETVIAQAVAQVLSAALEPYLLPPLIEICQDCCTDLIKREKKKANTLAASATQHNSQAKS